MATPTPPQPQGTDPAMMGAPAAPPVSAPQYVPDATGAYRKVIGAVSPFTMATQGDPAAMMTQEQPQITSNALTRRMQRNDDQARRQQEQPPSPIASQSL